MKTGILIGIAGASGSGKTFVASRIMERLGADKAVIIQEDSYYEDLSDIRYDERVVSNFDHPDAFDHDLLAKQLRRLSNGQAILQPVYDYKSHRRLEEIKTVDPCGLIILEGILILTDARLRDLMDLRVFIDTASDVCLRRRLERDMAERGRTADSVIRQYRETVHPMYLRFIEPSRQYADVVVSGAGENSEAVDALTARINAILHSDGQ